MFLNLNKIRQIKSTSEIYIEHHKSLLNDLEDLCFAKQNQAPLSRHISKISKSDRKKSLKLSNCSMIICNAYIL